MGATTNSPLYFATNDLERMRIDASGNVGIGTTTPAATLDVSGTMQIDGSTSTYTSYYNLGANKDVYIRAGLGAGKIVIGDQNTGTVEITGPGSKILSGNVGMGNASPGYALEIGSASAAKTVKLWMDGTQNYGLQLAYTGNTHTLNLTQGTDNNFYMGYNSVSIATINKATGVYGALSDRRLKKDIEPLTASTGLDAIMALNPVSFVFRNDTSATTQLGFIAQEVQKVLPELVTSLGSTTVTLDGKKTPLPDTKDLSYTGFIAPLVKAVQELKSYFDMDHAELVKLKAANDNLVSETSTLRAQLKAANDNHEKDMKELRKELYDFKSGVGWKRAVGR
jgi:hypothetical protein